MLSTATVSTKLLKPKRQSLIEKKSDNQSDDKQNKLSEKSQETHSMNLWRAWFFADNMLSTFIGNIYSTSGLVTAFWDLNELWNLPGISENGVFAGLPLALFFSYCVANGHDTETTFINRHATKTIDNAQIDDAQIDDAQTDNTQNEPSIDSTETVASSPDEKIIDIPIDNETSELNESIIGLQKNELQNYASLEEPAEEKEDKEGCCTRFKKSAYDCYATLVKMTPYQRMILLGHSASDILAPLASVILFGEVVSDRYDIDLSYRMLAYGGVALWNAGANVQEALNIVSGFMDEAKVALEM